MNREEALRTLGLDESANEADIKAAYRETAQILHPDKFASNKKLQNRATEQFKNLQEAYDCLISGKGTGAGRTKRGGSVARSSAQATGSSVYEAKLAGLAAARVQLVKQRDLATDERRNGFIMAAAGVFVVCALRRIPAIAAIASAAAVWGVVQVISSQRTITTINEHLARLKKEKDAIEEEMA